MRTLAGFSWDCMVIVLKGALCCMDYHDPMWNHPHSKPVDTHLNKPLLSRFRKPPGRLDTEEE